MPHPVDPNAGAHNRFDERLAAAEAAQARARGGDAQRAMAQGYRFLGEVVGGVLMGAGLGWLLDRFAGTQPLGLIGGLLIGTGLSIFVAVKTAARATKDQSANAGQTPDAPADDEDED
jgi:ATP synthase protein I